MMVANNHSSIMSLSDIKLAVFMSRATPLSRWAKRGLFERETAIYKRLAQQIGGLSIVTSGGEEELVFQKRLPGVEILYNRWGLSPNIYSLLAPILHRHALRKATIYKTNQLDGAWTAILAGKLHRRPVILRAGYPWAKNFRRENGDSIKTTLIEKLEAFSIKQANACMFSTPAMKQYSVQHYECDPEKIHIFPNYVDTHTFHPLENADKIPGRLCFIGRLVPVKNIPLLIEAVAQIPDVSLQLIGAGDQRSALEEIAKTKKAEVLFSGTIPHPQLPVQINRAEVFILASQYEGHPKALIEAMSCGAAVIGTDVEGISEVIQHRKTGLLCQPDVESIRNAIRELLANPALRAKLGRNARQFALENYALDNIVRREMELYQSVALAYSRS